MKNAARLALVASLALPVLSAQGQEIPTGVTAAPDSGPETAAPIPSAAAVASEAPADSNAGDAKSDSSSDGTSAPRQTGGSRMVEEIVVTAQRREEKLQEVPISVTAFTSEKLDALGIKTTEELPQVTPGLVLSNKAGYTIIYLRGVGTDAFLPAADPNVPIYVDGIPQLTNQGISNVLGRISRVEVLKGPQGTLFGRNSTGGAVSITTPDPTPEFGGEAGVEFGNYDTFNTSFFLNVPITDDLGATLSGYDNASDTIYKCVSCKVIDSYARGGRIKLAWQITDDFSLSGSAIYGETSNPLALLTKLQRPSPALSLGGVLLPKDETPGARNVRQNQPGGVVSVNHSFNFAADWKLEAIELKALGSTQHIGNPFAQWDFDSTDRAVVSFRVDDQYQDQKTFEVQALSNEGTPFAEYFSFVAGGFYLTGDGGFPNLVLQVGGEDGFGGTGAGILLGNSQAFDPFIQSLNTALIGAGLNPISALTGPITLTSGGIIETDSLSGYFQGTLNLQSTFNLDTPANLVLGARLDKETRGLRGARLGVLPPGLVDPHSFNPDDQIVLFNFNVPKVSDVSVPLRASLNWFPYDKIQVYTAWARGFTSPTYNPVNFFSPPDSLKAQQVDSFEVGAKTQLFDDTLTLNAAAFYIKEKDVLTGFLSITSGGIVRFDNAPAARIYGAEFDATWQVLPEINPGLVLTSSATYLNSEYTDYPDGRGFDVATGLSFGKGAFLPPRDFKGNDIVNTPKITLNAGINQALTLTDDQTMEFGADVFYNSGFYNVPQQEKLYHTDAFSVVNARVSYFYTPWGLETTAFVKNVLDKDYNAALFVSDFGVQNTLAPPRTYGLRIKLVF